MTQSSAAVRLMVMNDDESVTVRWDSGTQLQLSPCGCDCLLDDNSHRVRQRTRFTVSTYRELMIAALTFRNKYASRPYLPQELIPAIHKEPFVSIDSSVQWPDGPSCDAELGPRGETIIRSEDGKAALTLSPSGEAFSVEFTCGFSKADDRFHMMQHHSSSPGGLVPQQPGSSTGCLQKSSDETTPLHKGSAQQTRSRSCSAHMIPRSTAQPKPEEVYQSATVVQHHSCCDVAPMWCYPLSLAHHHWKARLPKPPGDVQTQETKASTQEDTKMSRSDVSSRDGSSHLPQALPLTCASPHWHRWKLKDPLSKQEDLDQDFATEPIKVMWCQGVTYRILGGTVSAIEVFPGDGSVIRSSSVRNSYFTHHKPELHTAAVNKVTYHLNSLPPDVPGQVYSVRSVVKHAHRILSCCNQAKTSLTLPAFPSCLQEHKQFSEMTLSEEKLCQNVTEEQHVIVTQTEESWSKLAAAELRKIKRFNFLLENNSLLRSEKEPAELGGDSIEVPTREAVDENWISEALQRTAKAIQDIDALISAATLTGDVFAQQKKF